MPFGTKIAYLTVKRVAELTGTSLDNVYKAIKRGKLSYLKFGRAYMIEKNDALKWRREARLGRPKDIREED